MSFEYNPNVFATEKSRNIYMERIDCWEHTKEYAKKFDKPPKSIKFKFDPNLVMEKKYKNTVVEVSNMDTIDCARLLLKHKFNPLVLNLADPHHASGCVSSGSHCQEESLFRTTNLCQTLKTINELYPIKDDEAILSKNIRILKTTEQSGWQLIKEPIFLDFIACCGIYMPKIDWTNNKKPKFKLDTDIEKLIIKIKLILQVAYLSQNDSIILGGLGVGAFRNPSQHTAEIFKAVLKEYDGVFKNIQFAILKGVDNQNTITKKYDKLPKDNYDIFKEVFDKK